MGRSGAKLADTLSRDEETGNARDFNESELFPVLAASLRQAPTSISV